MVSWIWILTLRETNPSVLISKIMKVFLFRFGFSLSKGTRPFKSCPVKVLICHKMYIMVSRIWINSLAEPDPFIFAVIIIEVLGFSFLLSKAWLMISSVVEVRFRHEMNIMRFWERWHTICFRILDKSLTSIISNKIVIIFCCLLILDWSLSKA